MVAVDSATGSEWGLVGEFITNNGGEDASGSRRALVYLLGNGEIEQIGKVSVTTKDSRQSRFTTTTESSGITSKDNRVT